MSMGPKLVVMADGAFQRIGHGDLICPGNGPVVFLTLFLFFSECFLGGYQHFLLLTLF